MATAGKDLSAFDPSTLTNCADFRIGIVVSAWNGHITERLLKGAIDVLDTIGQKASLRTILNVPGAFELPLGAQQLCQQQHIDGVLAIGVVIQGETRHFDFICDAVANGIANVTIKHNIPVAFGLLTTDTQLQAIERSGGKHGHKGEEAAWTVLKLLEESN